ncbi:hypothetical protein RI702_14075 [Clavibacter michiganensis]|uniref:DedA family protein n=1 Tax=Clavibacter michiganensis TaxID=28447 RepID=UPI003DA0A08E
MSAIQAVTPGEIHPSEGYDGFVGWVLSLIETLGEVGVGLAVLIETFVPPIPSEAILPVAGFLAYEGRMSAWGAWAAATIGALVGALIWYAIGAALGRNRTRRLVGRIPLLDHADFDSGASPSTRSSDPAPGTPSGWASASRSARRSARCSRSGAA